jgi:hypothetical protein
VVVQTPGADQSTAQVQVITPPTKLTDFTAEEGSGDGDDGDSGDTGGGDTSGGSSNGGTTSAPTVQDYEDAGVTGVDEGNVDDINEVIGNLPTGDKDTLDEIQSVVDAYNALLDTVDDPDSPLDLTAADYQALGFGEVDTGEEVWELNKRLSQATTQDIKPYAKLKALVDEVLAFVFQRAQPIPTLSPVALWAMVTLLLALGLMGQGRYDPLRRSSNR